MKRLLGSLARLRDLREARAAQALARAREDLAGAESRQEQARNVHEARRADLPNAHARAVREMVESTDWSGARAYAALRYRVVEEECDAAARALAQRAEETQAKRTDVDARADEWRAKRRDRIKLDALSDKI